MDHGAINISTELDTEKQKKAKQYARINRRLMLLDLIITGIYMFAWLLFGWSQALKQWLLTFTSNDWLLLFLYILVIGGIMYLINLPLALLPGLHITSPVRFIY